MTQPTALDWDALHPLARREIAGYAALRGDRFGKAPADSLEGWEKQTLNRGLVAHSRGTAYLVGFAAPAPDLPPPDPECPHCQDPYPAGEGARVATAYPTQLARRRDEVWCPHCAGHYTFACIRCKQTYSDLLRWEWYDAEPCCLDCWGRRLHWRR